MRLDVVYRGPAARDRRSTLRRPRLRESHRLEERSSSALGRRARRGSSAPATSRSNELRAYPSGLLRSPLDVRSATVAYRPGTSDASAAHDRPDRRLSIADGGLSSLDPAGRHLVRRDPRLVADRGVLGCGPRAHARARQGARGRLPRRHEGDAAACGSARRHGHDHAHGRRLRPRARHARALAVHRPRDALPVADARLRAARRRRGRRGAASRLRTGSWSGGHSHGPGGHHARPSRAQRPGPPR